MFNMALMCHTDLQDNEVFKQIFKPLFFLFRFSFQKEQPFFAVFGPLPVRNPVIKLIHLNALELQTVKYIFKAYNNKLAHFFNAKHYDKQ